MRASLDKVRVNAHNEWPNDEASRRRTPVTITMRNGQTFTRTVEKVRGSPGNPMTRDEVIAKCRDLVSPVLGASTTAKLIARVLDLENVKNVVELRSVLQPT